MLFRSFFDEQLAHMSYLVGCQRTGEAIVIDPGRNVDWYIDTAKKKACKLLLQQKHTFMRTLFQERKN